MSREAALGQTALQRWKARRPGVTWAELARRAKVSERLARKAAAGVPIGVVYAEALARATGLSLEDFATTRTIRSDGSPRPDR